MKEELKKRIKEIDNALDELLTKEKNPQGKIYEAAKYSLFAGGKRLRPMLLLECYKMCGGDDIKSVMPLACSMEMIHTYSLIHDDLPAMDNDDYRRGKPTNHKVYGEDIAILAGDALLNYAFETALSADGIDAELKLRAISFMAKSSGWDGMIGGQVVDLESEGKKISLEELRYIHSLKTGALIEASCTMGAILAGADEATISKVRSYAKNLGIAFQIQDDILDVIADEKELGKPVGSDAKNEKSTYVTICGLDKAKEYSKEYTAAAIDDLKCFGDNSKFLRDLTEYLLDRKS